MSTYTDKHSAVVAMLEQARNNHGYNMTDLEELTGITRSQLYRWINGDAKNIQQKSFQAVAHNLGYVITNSEDGIEVTHHIQNQGEPNMLQQLKDKERIILLQDEKIARLENELKQRNDTTCNHTFETMDYDVITYQTYNVEHEKPYKYFSSYEIVRWQDFCKKLGYVGQEAVELHNLIQAEGRNNLETYKGKKFNWMLQDDTQEHMCNYGYTYEFFNNAKLSNFVNAVESYNIQYIHKDGTYIPAIVTVLYDMKGISSVSKIKFLDTRN